MNLCEIKNLINTPKYDFLRQNPKLKDSIILLTLGGSYAYGTNIETSDVDYRGVLLESRDILLGLEKVEQVIDNATDTTIYAFNKIIPLLINCNPNVIEMLGCSPEHYVILTPLGKELLDNYDMFLSLRAKGAFGGYAQAQLRRLENALARDSYPQQEKEKHILNSIQTQLFHLQSNYAGFTNEQIKLYMDDSAKEDLQTEIFIDINLNHYPLRDLKSMLAEMNNVVQDYSKLNHRNKKKDNLHLNKHAMHLYRLFLTGIDLFESGKIITNRAKDHDVLMAIRNGKFQKEDGTYLSEFFDMVNKLEEQFNYAVTNSCLPEKPNYKRINEFVINVNERRVKGEI